MQWIVSCTIVIGPGLKRNESTAGQARIMMQARPGAGPAGPARGCCIDVHGRLIVCTHHILRASEVGKPMCPTPMGTRLTPMGTRLTPMGTRLTPMGTRLTPMGTRLPRLNLNAAAG
jgi:hypothetical protein